MAYQPNAYPLRIDKNLMQKLYVMAADHGRSANKEIEALIKAAIKQYEAENGSIQIPTDE